eukprot:CAMPEP_0113321690 /NCGR_PEP_ID=MMETSP0010_2-20120614/15087_1 /TAXON_ID=216773 ORGANISM="Corethron hystrix, Strain 308" /NCGR_SAMPLE_ID=MMETSP0010_2 /ASSEMBLY_ACC=CAM_ASM_000155 /LENGTH=50 /DNA_ID=CAMNT_0000179901 /DNA_START=470 /DNA_END=619 /DNA_ORIENTATION=- /assembly_acc=CAM_ASM_000155
MAVRRLPKQMEPKEYVVARENEPRTASEQHEDAIMGLYHHDPTVPATVVW